MTDADHYFRARIDCLGWIVTNAHASVLIAIDLSTHAFTNLTDYSLFNMYSIVITYILQVDEG
jgi:hypothetical protein